MDGVQMTPYVEAGFTAEQVTAHAAAFAPGGDFDEFVLAV